MILMQMIVIAEWESGVHPNVSSVLCLIGLRKSSLIADRSIKNISKVGGCG
jgi:hypothetical protein